MLNSSLKQGQVERWADVAGKLVCTNLTDREVIFGSTDRLTELIALADQRFAPEMIAVVTACVVGVIGDDVAGAVREAQSTVSGRLIAVDVDGFLRGHFYSGVDLAMEQLLLAFVDEDVCVEPTTVNILGEKNMAVSEERDFQEVQRLLGLLNLRVGTRFVRQTNTEGLAKLGRASVNILRDPSIADYPARFLAANLGTPHMTRGYPVGISETRDWLMELASLTDSESTVRQAISVEEAAYENDLMQLRLTSRELGVAGNLSGNPWIDELASDSGIRVIAVGPQERPESLPVYTVPSVPPTGTSGVRGILREWYQLVNHPQIEGWRRDVEAYGLGRYL